MCAHVVTCKFHPGVAATDKCEECGAPICLQCKQVFRVRSTSTSTGSYATKYDLCPICYEKYRKRRGQAQKLGLICCCFIGFIGIGMVLSIIVIGVIMMALMLMGFQSFLPSGFGFP